MFVCLYLAIDQRNHPSFRSVMRKESARLAAWPTGTSTSRHRRKRPLVCFSSVIVHEYRPPQKQQSDAQGMARHVNLIGGIRLSEFDADTAHFASIRRILNHDCGDYGL